MKEKNYVDATNLTKIRIVSSILREVIYPTDASKKEDIKKILSILTKHEADLYKEIDK